ncbi:putative deoxyribonuclease TATDN2 [Saccostrea cucullata]|uniref:putative deoxyribonuclease TATDN2 n=1 Tax=Saccostrea cuccullata TaxID=36930 RepID=UPI002ED6288B
MSDYMEEALFVPDYEEDMEDDSVKVPERPKILSGRKCPLCTARTPAIKPHVLRSHLPWYFGALTACWKCGVQEGKQCFLRAKHINAEGHPEGALFNEANRRRWVSLMNGLLHRICYHIGLGSLDNLLCFVVEKHLYVETINPAASDFTDGEVELLNLYEDANGLARSQCFSIHPPTSVASLVHWRIICNLLQLLLPAGQRDVIATMQELTFSGNLLAPVLSLSRPDLLQQHFGDSHFHLDILLSRTRLRDFSALEDEFGDPDFRLSVAIANYVFPEHWERFRQQARDPRIYLTFGLHPHTVKSDYSMELLRELLKEPGCVGLGEVGLDFTTSCRCSPRCQSLKRCKKESIARQRAFLREILPLAKDMDLTLVVHCRDLHSGYAAREFLALLEELGLTDLRIHRHCYIGSPEEAIAWMERLPNVKFGFTSSLLGLFETADALCAMPMERILLESDAPYLPPTSRMDVNTPWALLPVAERVAKLKRTTVSDVLTQTLHNLKCLYRI